MTEERPNSNDARDAFINAPYIKNLNYRIDTHGEYEGGKPSGITIHNTVSPTQGKSPEQQAAGVLNWLSHKGWGALVLASDGQFYKGYSHHLDKKTWHSGPSYWDKLGTKNVHHYSIGIEVCNAGRVGKRRNGYHPAWHFKDWDIDGALKPNVKPMSLSVREVNYPFPQKPGLYECYSKAQEQALLDFCIWACLEWDINPDNIQGHDEIDKRGFKSDPGGAMSMSMKDFRKKVSQAVALAKRN